MNFTIRKADLNDRAELEKLISASVRGLSREDYDERQVELSIKTVFGVDTELIADRTYFVAEANGKIVGCGGWSKRKTLYGASVYSQSRDSNLLDPEIDAAKIRAFFIHPDYARRGIGKAILEVCESEAKQHNFKSAEMMATLPGVKLYAVCGYEGDEQIKVSIGENAEIICVKMRKIFLMKYVAFLRGINVGGKNKIKMETLREVCAALQFQNVKTYINSGNIIFETVKSDDLKLAAKIENAIEKEFALKIKVIVRQISEIEQIVKNNPFAGQLENDKDLHVFFLDEEMPADKRELLLSNNSENETYFVRNREIFCLLRVSVLDSLMGKDYVGKKLKISATARNWRTVNKILEF